MIRCDFSIAEVTEDTVYLIDLDRGAMSVTNDAEAVYETVRNSYPNRKVVYRDSDGEWSEIYQVGKSIAWRDHAGVEV